MTRVVSSCIVLRPIILTSVYVVKEDLTSETQFPVEGNIKELTGKYEVNIIGRSTIQEETTRVIEGKNATISLLEVGNSSKDAVGFFLPDCTVMPNFLYNVLLDNFKFFAILMRLS
jgi:hypothetical protein